MSDRRRFLVTSMAGALAVPLLAEAAQAGKHTIGVPHLGSAISLRPYLDAFREGLRERGYIEADSLAIELRSADDQADRLPARVAELLALKVRVS